MSTIEKRKHPRRETFFFTVARRLGEDGEACLPRAGYARDISPGGVFFHTEDSVRQGERMLVSIYPDSGWKAGGISLKLVAEGQVLRAGRVSPPHLPRRVQGVAVKFDRQPEIALEDHDIASLTLLMGPLLRLHPKGASRVSPSVPNVRDRVVAPFPNAITQAEKSLLVHVPP